MAAAALLALLCASPLLLGAQASLVEVSAPVLAWSSRALLDASSASVYEV